MNRAQYKLKSMVFAVLFAALVLVAQDKSADAPGAGNGQGTTRPTVVVNGVRERVYSMGKGVKPPQAIYSPPPEYSEEARRDRVEGIITLGVVVTSAGNVALIRVLKSLGHGLDEKAIEAVRRWKFDPATKDGTPVSVEIAVENNFRLYQHR